MTTDGHRKLSVNVPTDPQSPAAAKKPVTPLTSTSGGSKCPLPRKRAGGGGGSGGISGGSTTSNDPPAAAAAASSVISPYLFFYPETVLERVSVAPEEANPALGGAFFSRVADRARKQAYISQHSGFFAKFAKGNLSTFHRVFLQHVLPDGTLQRPQYRHALACLGGGGKGKKGKKDREDSSGVKGPKSGSSSSSRCCSKSEKDPGRGWCWCCGGGDTRRPWAVEHHSRAQNGGDSPAEDPPQPGGVPAALCHAAGARAGVPHARAADARGSLPPQQGCHLVLNHRGSHTTPTTQAEWECADFPKGRQCEVRDDWWRWWYLNYSQQQDTAGKGRWGIVPILNITHTHTGCYYS